MDFDRLVLEHETAEITLSGSSDGILRYEGTLTGAQQSLSDALVAEHIEDISTYVKANLNTVCPTVKSLMSGEQWAAYIVLQKKVRKVFVQRVSEEADIEYLYQDWQYAVETSDPNAGDKHDEWFNELDSIKEEYPDD